ncbi:hypothetical protein, partial [Limnohabitans lacus]
ESIEKIDLTGDGSRVLVLTQADVLALSDNDTLIVQAKSGDIVFAVGNWVDTGELAVGFDGNTYRLYTSGAASLLVSAEASFGSTVNVASQITELSISDDTGSDSTDRVTTDTTLVYNVTLGQSLAAGDELQIIVDGTAHTATRVDDTHYSLDRTANGQALAVGAHSVWVSVARNGEFIDRGWSGHLNVQAQSSLPRPTQLDMRTADDTGADRFDNSTVNHQNIMLFAYGPTDQNYLTEFWIDSNGNTQWDATDQQITTNWLGGIANTSPALRYLDGGRANAYVDLSTGVHNIYATFKDTQGTRSQASDILQVTVLGEEPSLSFIGQSGYTLTGTASEGSEVFVWVDANHNGVSEAAETRLGYVYSGVNGQWSLSLAALGAGNHDIRAMTGNVIDRITGDRTAGAGLVQLNGGATIDVEVPTVDAVAFNSPASGVYVTGTNNMLVTVTFSEEVKGLIGSSKLVLTLNGNVQRNAYLQSTDAQAKTATFVYSVQSGDDDLDGVEIVANAFVGITDVFGNAVDNTYTLSDVSSARIDVSAPVVEAAAGVDTTVNLLFNEVLDASTAPLAGAFTLAGNTVTGVAISGNQVT